MFDDLSTDRTLGGGAGGREKWSLAEGDSLGGYRVVRPLGRGGMGEVYLVRHERMGKLYAMKLIAPERAADGEFRERFAVEARVMADLDHPGVVGVHYMGDEDGRLFLVMDYVEGPEGGPMSLADLLAAKGRFPEAEARRIVLEVARALEYAHGFRDGVVHRDLKPGNILIDPDGRARVSDFGLAKVMGAEYMKGLAGRGAAASLSAARTMAMGGGEGPSASEDAMLGTFEFMAPEQEEGRADARSDIYSLGLVAYRMLTGEKAKGAFAMPSELGCAAEWDAVIRKALAPRPNRRYPRVSRLIEDVEAIGRPAAARQREARPPAPPRRLSPEEIEARRQRSRAVGRALRVLALLVLGAGVVGGLGFGGYTAVAAARRSAEGRMALSVATHVVVWAVIFFLALAGARRAHMAQLLVPSLIAMGLVAGAVELGLFAAFHDWRAVVAFFEPQPGVKPSVFALIVVIGLPTVTMAAIRQWVWERCCGRCGSLSLATVSVEDLDPYEEEEYITRDDGTRIRRVKHFRRYETTKKCAKCGTVWTFTGSRSLGHHDYTS